MAGRSGGVRSRKGGADEGRPANIGKTDLAAAWTLAPPSLFAKRHAYVVVGRSHPVQSAIRPLRRVFFEIMHLPKILSRRRTTAERPLPETVELSSGTVALVVRRNPRAKRLIMRLARNATAVAVTAPTRTPNAVILAFVERHKSWAEHRIDRAPAGIAVAAGARLPFRGGFLDIEHAPGRGASRLDAVGDGLWRLTVGGAPEHLPRRVMDALKREARRDLQASVDRHAAAVGLFPAALTLKDTRSRWGSCTADRRLSFSWRIAMAPPAVLDYLAAHEVAHFREMNHGPAFWALCAKLCPAMETGRDWLKRHGASLHAVRFD